MISISQIRTKHQRRHCSVFGYHHAARHVSTTAPIQEPEQAHRETPTETLDGWTSPNTNYGILHITALFRSFRRVLLAAKLLMTRSCAERL